MNNRLTPAENLYRRCNASALPTISKQSNRAAKTVELPDVANAVLNERRRLARELHDSVTQSLYVVTLKADALLMHPAVPPGFIETELKRIAQLTRGAMAEIQALLLEMRPETIEKTGLTRLIRQLADTVTGQLAIPVTFSTNLTDESFGLSGPVRVELYRIAQESLNNIIKHACATHIDINLVCFDGVLQLCICDDGVGFEPIRLTSGFGLENMRERAAKIDAQLEIVSQPGSGTQINVVWRSPSDHERN